MNYWLSFDQIRDDHVSIVGGKAVSLARLMRAGLDVPPGGCVTAGAYRRVIDRPGFRERLWLTLDRKSFGDMRWEEMWDAALRIRNLFLHTQLPEDVEAELSRVFTETFSEEPVVVRSSSPAEDSSRASFAGLHESFVNIRATDDILKHVRLVWASLWSDRSLLYRKEMNLDVRESTMAAIVQKLIPGDRSGVAFCVNPVDHTQGVVEAVHGLNAGLVDGEVEPDRWILDRERGEVISHNHATRESAARPDPTGYSIVALPEQERQRPPLSDDEAVDVYGRTRRCEEVFGTPQDVEWTFGGDRFFLLQSRPITTGNETDSDPRKWYLTLTRSLANLKQIGKKLQQEVIPRMEDEATRLAAVHLGAVSDEELREEVRRRDESLGRWMKAYWDLCIPYAHGMRLFGQVYNDTMEPDDPYEFMDLLTGRELISLERNRRLETLAARLRSRPDLADRLRSRGTETGDPEFDRHLEDYVKEYGHLYGLDIDPGDRRLGIVRILLEMTKQSHQNKPEKMKDPDLLEKKFLASFEGKSREFAEDVLRIGRSSYALRDNDNHYLARIEAELRRALDEAARRGLSEIVQETTGLERIVSSPRLPRDELARGPGRARRTEAAGALRGKQFVGQPSGPGIATGMARVVRSAEDAFRVEAGEILVCDAIEPGITFVVPLVAGIVERRGGMLIHGAIIARECGLPCVTGVPDATKLIETGQMVTVDGFLGIVSVTLDIPGAAPA